MMHVFRDPFRSENPATGTWCRGAEYYELMHRVLGTFDSAWPIQPKYHYPLFMNLGHALELALKAYLLAHDVDQKKLRKIGHDLSQLMNIALERGLSERCALADGDRHVVDMMSEPFRMTEFRYAEPPRDRRFPDFKTVLALVHRLLAGTADECDPRGGAATKLSPPETP